MVQRKVYTSTGVRNAGMNELLDTARDVHKRELCNKVPKSRRIFARIPMRLVNEGKTRNNLIQKIRNRAFDNEVYSKSNIQTAQSDRLLQIARDIHKQQMCDKIPRVNRIFARIPTRLVNETKTRRDLLKLHNYSERSGSTTVSVSSQPTSRKTQKKLAMNKINAILKGKKAQQQFKQLMKNVNAAHQRRRIQMKKLLNVPNQFTSTNILVPSSMVTNKKMLSYGSTGSGAAVASLNTNYGTFVCKITKVLRTDCGAHEVKMYDMVNNLVDDNVTPFLMKSVMHKYNMHVTKSGPPNKRIHPEARKLMKLKGGKHHVLLNESVEGDKVETFFDFVYRLKLYNTDLTKSVYNTMDPSKSNQLLLECIIFQVVWTIECFNKIGMRHNDLHSGNILLVQHNRPSNTHRIFKMKNSRGKQEVFYVPTTKWEVRIFDFDRSAKRSMTGVKNQYKPSVKLQTSNTFFQYAANHDENRQLDFYKFMQPLPVFYTLAGNKYSTKLNSTQLSFESKAFDREYFLKFNLLIANETDKNKTYGISGYPFPEQLILHIGKKLFSKPPPNSKLVEIYDMDNIHR